MTAFLDKVEEAVVQLFPAGTLRMRLRILTVLYFAVGHVIYCQIWMSVI